MNEDLRQQIPEINENQWKLLERTILECLPEKQKQVIKAYSSPMWTSGRYCDTCGSDIIENTNLCGCYEFNKAIDLTAAAITNVFNKGDKV